MKNFIVFVIAALSPMIAQADVDDTTIYSHECLYGTADIAPHFPTMISVYTSENDSVFTMIKIKYYGSFGGTKGNWRVIDFTYVTPGLTAQQALATHAKQIAKDTRIKEKLILEASNGLVCAKNSDFKPQ